MDRKHSSEPTDTPPGNRITMQRLMRRLGKLLPPGEGGENARAVTLFHRMDVLRDVLAAGPLRRVQEHWSGKVVWPVTPGAYIVTDPTASVAICTLTSNELMTTAAALSGVAIAGRIYTPNLGIEKIIINVTSNPAIRFLLLCGRESPIFHPAQALQALFTNGVDADQRIIGATGHLPVLQHIAPTQIAAFLRQVELVDYTSEMDLVVIGSHVQHLAARNPGPFAEQQEDSHGQSSGALAKDELDDAPFTLIRPGGHRESLAYDPKGFFVITLDRPANEILLRHYLPDMTPQYLLRGRSAEAMLLGLLRENLVSQLSHAGYLGAELAKAEAALRLNLRYEQDQPLRMM